MSSNSSSSATVPSFGSPLASRTTQIYVSGCICFAFAVFTVGLRFFTRIRLTSAGLWLDDWLIIVALVAQTGMLISVFVMIHFGLGHHVDLADPAKITGFYKTYIPVAVFYITTYGFTKLSILALFFRIFGKSSPRLRSLIYFVAVFTISWTIACDLVNIFQCRPVAFWWDREIPDGWCINNTAFLLGNTLPNIITDWIILLMPVPIIWRLNQTTKQKIALIGCFMLGGFVSAVTIIRFVIQLETDYTSPDLPWTVVDFAIWSAVETNVAIICACLPSLRPIFKWKRSGTTSARWPYADNTPSAKRSELNSFQPNNRSSGGGGSRRTWQPLGKSSSNSSDIEEYHPLADGSDIKSSTPRSESRANAIYVEREITVTHDQNARET